MNQDSVRIQQVHWTQVFPLLRLFEAASIGCRLSTLCLSALCLILSWTGSWALVTVFQIEDHPKGFPERPREQLNSRSHAQRSLYGFRAITETDEIRGTWRQPPRWRESISAMDVVSTPQPLPAPVNVIWRSGVQTFLPGQENKALKELSPLLLIWNMAVVAVLGVAIARASATRFCQQTRTGLTAALKLGLPLYRRPLLGAVLVLCLAAGLRMLLGTAEWIAGLGEEGRILVNIGWGGVFLVGVLLWMFLLIGGVAWGLSVSACGTDQCQGAEGLSRSLSYVLSHRLWTVLAVFIVGVLSAAVRRCLELVLSIGLMWIPQSLKELDTDPFGRGWMSLITLLPPVVHLSVFLSGITILYVLLRQREDGITLRELDGAVN